MQIPLLSFFSGGGFLDIGFEQAGFSVIWTNEIKDAFADMYEAALSGWKASRGELHASVKVTERVSIEGLTPERVIEKAFPEGTPPIFGVIGGSPCPDFSVSGKNTGVTGERGKLTQVFVDMICKLRPTFFVMENVPGLARQKKHRSYFNRMIAQFSEGDDGYAVDSKVLNSLEYGVPQDRERLFLIGFQKKYVSRAHLSQILLHGGNWFTWPQPIYPGAMSLNWPSKVPKGTVAAKPFDIPIELTVYPCLSGDVEDLPNGNEVFKPYSKKFWEIVEGDVAGKSFKRLHRYRYSPTVWYGNNEVHLHPWKPRRLSVREALRIQTVPDTYILPSEYTLTDKFKMITNGVPCRLSRYVAQGVQQYLDEILAVSSRDRGL